MKVNIHPEWYQVLENEFEKQYFIKLTDLVKQEYKKNTVYPPGSFIFNAFDLCPPSKIKVVIIGQDPYHGHGQAHGLSFSVPNGITLPPSLKNIYKELKSDLNIPIPTSGDLTHWAKQGVLLLNATLTVCKGKPGSHQKKGWEQFTNNVISIISNTKKNIVYILWGAYAKQKSTLINSSQNLIIESTHPSPFSANYGFFGSKPFSNTNKYLTKTNQTPIQW